MGRTESWAGVSYPGLGSIYLGYEKVRLEFLLIWHAWVWCHILSIKGNAEITRLMKSGNLGNRIV